MRVLNLDIKYTHEKTQKKEALNKIISLLIT